MKGLPPNYVNMSSEIIKAPLCKGNESSLASSSSNLTLSSNEHTNLPFSDRKRETRNCYAFEEDQPESSSNEDSFDEVTMITISVNHCIDLESRLQRLHPRRCLEQKVFQDLVMSKLNNLVNRSL
ncbi:unnamed protein product [Lactuca saligna]|uniref:Uncharacterized protein n=1 Tax=Lactuca saligna TaxID=75948 RepID=A0AA35VK99_LACSI|nr:unnamed protein product [Lactuca saligna]